MAHEPELNAVRLQAEKIELTSRVRVQEERLDKLQVLLAQAASNHPEVYAALEADDDSFFVTLRKRLKAPKKGAGETVSIEEYDQLEKDFYAGIEREKEYKDTIDRLQADLAKAHRARVQADTTLQDLRAQVTTLQQALDDAPASPVAPPPPFDPEAEVEQRVNDIIAARLEEEVFAATMELQDQLAAAQTELETLKLDGPGADSAEVARLQSERDAAVAAADKAASAQKIAVRVKEGALLECAQAKTQLEKTRSELEALKGGASPPRVGLTRTVSEAEAQADAFIEKRAEDLRQHSEEVAALNARIAGLEAQLSSTESNRDTADRARRELLDRNTTLLTQLQDTSAARDRLRDEAGQHSTDHREAEAKEQRYQDQIERLRQSLALSDSAPQMDAEAVRDVVNTVQMVYQTLVAELQRADDAEAKQQVLCDLLFDYEGRLWHLQNEVKSIRTIVEIKMQDKEDEAAAQTEEAMSRLEILRMQLREAKLSPQC